jgi:protein-S-isoprenylcysteine O-methyltransferase Ste14
MKRPRVRGASREDLAGEHRFGDTGQALFAVLFGAVWVLDSFFLEWTTFLGAVIPTWLRTVVGCTLLAVSGFLAFFSMRRVFGEVRDPPAVIRSGLYASMRHPMYLSEVLLYAGFFSLSLSLAAAVVALAATVFLSCLCRHEERLLIDRFGDDYRTYMREVPMWLPRFRKKGAGDPNPGA